MTPAPTEHAVVTGASIAGLLAARALADHVEQVTLVERDELPPVGEGRRGVPQGRHVHGLMAKGLEIIERLLPGITDELVAHGAPLTDPRVNGRWFLNGGYYDSRRAGAGQPTLLVGRPLLEGVIRARVLQLPNVRVIERCDALGLVADQHRRRVTGVHVLRRRAGSAEEVVAADLVVDASGRASRASAWLQALGYDPPVEERIAIDLAYTSRQFRRLPTDLDGDHFAMVFPDPATTRAGLAAAQQDDRWLVTLAGYLGERAPTDDAGYREYARSLRAADVWDVVRSAEPLDTATTMRFPASVRRRYEWLRSFPDRFVVTGDALCSFNPVYAQGITVAALESEILSACLRRGVNQLGRRFFRHAGAVIESAWRISAGGDLRFTQVAGKRTSTIRAVNWYLDRLHLSAHHDPIVASAFQRVVNMQSTPTSLLAPGITLRVARHHARRRRDTSPNRMHRIDTEEAQVGNVVGDR